MNIYYESKVARKSMPKGCGYIDCDYALKGYETIIVFDKLKRASKIIMSKKYDKVISVTIINLSNYQVVAESKRTNPKYDTTYYIKRNNTLWLYHALFYHRKIYNELPSPSMWIYSFTYFDKIIEVEQYSV